VFRLGFVGNVLWGGRNKIMEVHLSAGKDVLAGRPEFYNLLSQNSDFVVQSGASDSPPS
jgi:hypothetical protein